MNINNIVISENRVGRFYLPTDAPRDCIINSIRSGNVFEPEVVETIERNIKLGQNVVDLGANFGQMTILMSKIVGEKGSVISVEADKSTSIILQANVELNDLKNVTLFQKAIWKDSKEFVPYPEPDENLTKWGTYGSYGIELSSSECRVVETTTIDEICNNIDISFIKSDVQGSDLFALQGGKKTIKRCNPLILFEIEDYFLSQFNLTRKDYFNFIDEIDYKIIEIISDSNYLIGKK